MRTPVPHRSPPARIFAEQKCLATDKVSQICCSAGRSSDILQTSKAVHTRKRVLPKYVETLDWVGTVNLGLPGSQKGRNPFVFTRKRKKQLLPGGSTRRFFAQLRSVGSNHPAGRLLPVNLWRLRHGKKPRTKHNAMPLAEKQKPPSQSVNYPV